MIKYFLFLLLVVITINAGAQTDTTAKANSASAFEKIMGSVQNFKPDTSAVPADKLTKQIMVLRQLRGGFNINEAIDFKLEEDRQKGEMPVAELEQLAYFFKNGNGKKWLDNAVIWIYRNHFTYKQVRQLVKFYKTGAGQKMADVFPVTMLQSLAAAEMLKAQFLASQKQP